MTHVGDIMDLDVLEQHIRDRYVNRKEDPRGTGYVLYDYSQHAQFDRVWDDVTMQCRGLITDPIGRIVARPLRKFFNLGEMDSIPDGEFTVQEKVDGSLAIPYFMPDGSVCVATRGSFMSEQAVWATAWLYGHPEHLAAVKSVLETEATPLFEIVYPDNRIVVDYGKREELVYLATIDIATGDDVDWDGWPGTKAINYVGLDMETLAMFDKPNMEGFVLRWPCGTRAKAKTETYVRLHRLLTGVNAKTIWELLMAHMSIEPLLELVPDEFYQWVKNTVAELNQAYTAIECIALAELSEVPRDVSRKEQAAIVTQGHYPGIVFAMLDQKPFAEKIWKMIRPEAAKPFRCDGDL